MQIEQRGRLQRDAVADMRANTYAPHPIAGRVFSFSGETMAAESRTEIALVRFDEMVRHCSQGKGLATVLNRAEAMATVRSDGVVPDMKALLFLEFLHESECAGDVHPHEMKLALHRQFPEIPAETAEASYEAFCCMRTLEWIGSYTPKEQGLTVEDVWNLYALCMRGTRKERLGAKRLKNVVFESCGARNSLLYVCPDYTCIENLMDDLVKFCNAESLSPLTRAAVAHFQLEAIKPVEECLDRWGRMLALLLFRQCGLVRTVLPPFSLTPAAETQRHTTLLIPYQTGQAFEQGSAMHALDAWAAHCAHATYRSVILAQAYLACIEKVEDAWRVSCSGAHSGSVLDMLLSRLAAHPFISVPLACKLTGRSYQSCAEAIERLRSLGIVRPLKDGKRNRVFVAEDAVREELKLQDSLLPDKAVARERFFRGVRQTFAS